MAKRKTKKWEKVDREAVKALMQEFQTMHALYTAQGVDPLAIASAFLASGQWAMNKELGLKETQDLLKLLANYKYEVIAQTNNTIHQEFIMANVKIGNKTIAFPPGMSDAELEKAKREAEELRKKLAALEKLQKQEKQRNRYK